MELPVPIDELRITPQYPALIASLEKNEFKSLLQEVRDEAVRARPRCREAYCSEASMAMTAGQGKVRNFMKFREKFRTRAGSYCPIRQVKAIRAVARLDLMFLLGVRCPNLFLP